MFSIQTILEEMAFVEKLETLIFCSAVPLS